MLDDVSGLYQEQSLSKKTDLTGSHGFWSVDQPKGNRRLFRGSALLVQRLRQVPAPSAESVPSSRKYDFLLSEWPQVEVIT